LTVSAWDVDNDHPTMKITREFRPGQWQYVAGLADKIDFKELQATYGCPDCADGGAESITYQNGAVSKTVVFEFGNPPDELRPLADTLRAIRRTMLDKSDS
jgi:hypothetical protein